MPSNALHVHDIMHHRCRGADSKTCDPVHAPQMLQALAVALRISGTNRTFVFQRDHWGVFLRSHNEVIAVLQGLTPRFIMAASPWDERSALPLYIEPTPIVEYCKAGRRSSYSLASNLAHGLLTRDSQREIVQLAR